MIDSIRWMRRVVRAWFCDHEWIHFEQFRYCWRCSKIDVSPCNHPMIDV
jgi:hypothetical protein